MIRHESQKKFRGDRLVFKNYITSLLNKKEKAVNSTENFTVQ